MSVFSPVNVAAPPDRKRQLVQKLMDQMQASAQRAAGLGVASQTSRPIGGGGHITGLLPTLAPGLARLLGPGGFGNPIAGRESSGEIGQSVGPGLGANPHANPAASLLSGLGSAGAMPAAPMPTGNAALAPSLPSAIANTPRTAPGAATYNGYDAPMGGTAAFDPGFNVTGNAAASPSSGHIPLGNGLFYDPVTDTIVQRPQGMPAPTTSGGGGGGRMLMV